MEFLKILDSEGRPKNSKVEYGEVHQKGFWHQTVHIWIILKKSKILFQKRSCEKENYPNFFDISCAGHVRYNEPVWKAAAREIHEELGFLVSKKDLVPITRFKNQGILNFFDSSFDGGGSAKVMASIIRFSSTS